MVIFSLMCSCVILMVLNVIQYLLCRKAYKQRDNFMQGYEDISRWLMDTEKELNVYKKKYGSLKVEKKKGRPKKYKQSQFDRIIKWYEKNSKLTLKECFEKVGIPYYSPINRMKTYGIYDKYLELKENREKNMSKTIDKK